MFPLIGTTYKNISTKKQAIPAHVEPSPSFDPSNEADLHAHSNGIRNPHPEIHKEIQRKVDEGSVDGVHYDRTKNIKRKFLSGFGDKAEKKEAARLRTIENLKRKAHREGIHM
jgi:hypothetical protein